MIFLTREDSPSYLLQRVHLLYNVSVAFESLCSVDLDHRICTLFFPTRGEFLRFYS